MSTLIKKSAEILRLSFNGITANELQHKLGILYELYPDDCHMRKLLSNLSAYRIVRMQDNVECQCCFNKSNVLHITDYGREYAAILKPVVEIPTEMIK